MSDEKDTAASPESEETTATNDEIIGTPEPEFHIYVRHIGRSAVNRAQRKARAGHRRQGATLDNGLRIRKKGRMRLTKIALKEFVDNHERLFFYIDNGIIEAIDSATMKAIPRDELLNMLHGLTDNVKVGDEILPPALITGMVAHPPTRPQDVTRTDLDAAAMTAAADQAEAQKTGEANPPPSEQPEDPGQDHDQDEGLTEADLKKMSRKELDQVAKDNDVNPDDYSNKNELIEALLEE